MKTLISFRVCSNRLTSAVLAMFCLLLAGSSFATTRTVTSLADSGAGSLRSILAISGNNDSINFQSGLTGTIFLTSGELDIEVNLTITGPGASHLSVSGSHASRVFNIDPTTIVNISGLTITDGHAAGADGSLAVPTGSDGSGGGIYNAGNLTLNSCVIVLNTATGGNGLNSTTNQDGSPADGGNGGSAYGGGIFNSGTLTLNQCQVGINSAFAGDGGSNTTDPSYNIGGDGGKAFGGGICSAQGVLILRSCTLYANSAGGGNGGAGQTPGQYGESAGGGIGNVFDTSGIGVALTNCTIAGNSATSGWAALGGGIFATQTPLTLMCCTIAGNSSADLDGGGLQFTGDVVPTLGNTIISGNTISDPDAEDPDLPAQPVNSLGFNLIGKYTAFLGADSDLIGYDPLLGPLQNNGGPTLTMALLPGSPAVDQGYSFGLSVDQRGQFRPFNFLGVPNAAGGDGSDIGAFEAIPAPPMLTGSIHSTFINFNWVNQSPGIASKTNIASFGLETVQLAGSNAAGQWTTFTNPVRTVNGQVVAREFIVPGAATLHRLNSAVANPIVIPPPVTLAVTGVTSNSATFNGTTTPYGFNTLYWFEFGTDTNYGLSSVTSQLATSADPYDLVNLSVGIDSLNPSTTYHCQLVVQDDDGTNYGGDVVFSTPSLTLSAPVVITTPATDVTSNSPTSYSALLNGSVNPEKGATVAWFYYYSDTFTGQTTPQSVGSGTAAVAFSQNATGLLPNTTYYFEIVASNDLGVSYGQPYLSFSTTPAYQPPPTVLTLAPTSVTTSSAVLNGSVNANNANNGVTTAYFQFGLDTNVNDLVNTTPFFPNGNSTQDYSYAATGLAANTTYYYRVHAYTSNYQVFSAFTSFNTAALPQPPTLVAPGSTSTNPSAYAPSLTPTFAWNANGAASYDCFLAQYPSGASPQSVTGLTGNSATPFTLQPGTNYSWYMTALDSFGNQSGPSATFYFISPSAPAVQTLAATNIGPHSAALQGFVNPHGLDTTFYFQYGTTTSYGSVMPATPSDLGSLSQFIAVPVTNLGIRTIYHFRCVASNSQGTTVGGDLAFETSPE